MGPPESSYEGLFAEYYDLLHADRGDAAFYAELAREAGAPVLELGCGTGRLLIPVAEAGTEVTGLDASAAMLEVCRGKLAYCGEEARSRATLVRAGMEDFELGRRFTLAYLSCNTLNGLLSREERLAVLRRCRAHLAEGGRVLLDAVVPDLEFYREIDGKERTFEFTDPLRGRVLVEKVIARLDPVRQTVSEDALLEEYDEGRLLRSSRARSGSALLFPGDLESLVEEAGFGVLHRWKNPAKETFDLSASRLLLLARRS
ncbi:MAG: class I SAM-dependent methyltransferase [Elusimicrobiota bacterium]|jgi:SAM-dependent methyltransferase